jgi:hypothetical protein
MLSKFTYIQMEMQSLIQCLFIFLSNHLCVVFIQHPNNIVSIIHKWLENKDLNLVVLKNANALAIK